MSVVNIIIKGKYDAILLTGYNRLTDWLVFVTARLTRTPIIFRGEATLRPRRINVPFRSRFKHRFLSQWLRRCAAVLYSCGGNCEYFESYGVPIEKMRCIPCAVDNEFFQAEAKRNYLVRDKIREELGLPKNDFVVILAAQLTPRKHPADLIEAIAISGRSDVAALFIGHGPLRKDLEALARKRGVRAVFTGFVNQGEISRYYVVGDMFAMLSEYDASPKALNEALNFAMPAICTRATGTAFDLVEDHKNGFHIDSGDINSIAMHISKLANDRDLAYKMGRRSLEIIKDWSFTADADSIQTTIKGII